MNETQIIQWFPGHMAKTRRKITESLKLVDAVAEIVDARIPASSRNPELAGIIAKKPLLILLNKSDMADPKITEDWCQYFKEKGIMAIPVDSKSGGNTAKFQSAVRELLKEKIEQNIQKGMVGKALRVMVVGIPNVGKSSFINRMTKNVRAKVEDRPGVTRGNQWFKIDKDLELLDTPGVLWPKFDDMSVGEKLAFCGSVKDEVLDIELLAVRLIEYLRNTYPQSLLGRYKITSLDGEPFEVLEAIGKKRGMMIKGGEVDSERASKMLLDEFRGCKIGRISLEKPER